MLGEELSTDGPIHIYCSKQTNPLEFYGKGQLEVKQDDTMMLCKGSCQSYKPLLAVIGPSLVTKVLLCLVPVSHD